VERAEEPPQLKILSCEAASSRGCGPVRSRREWAITITDADPDELPAILRARIHASGGRSHEMFTLIIFDNV